MYKPTRTKELALLVEHFWLEFQLYTGLVRCENEQRANNKKRTTSFYLTEEALEALEEVSARWGSAGTP